MVNFMSEVSFFTPLCFEDRTQCTAQPFMESVDDYFYLGGKKALVISGQQQGAEGALLYQQSSHWLMTALKVVSYATIIIPVIMLIIKAVMRSLQHFQFIDLKAQLEEGMEIPSHLTEKVEALMPKITQGQNDPEIHWLSQGNNFVFTLEDNPEIVFKMARHNRFSERLRRMMTPEELMEERFENMIKAKEVCLVHHLGLLVIPQAKKIQIAGRTLIAERRINIIPNASVQEDLHAKHTRNLTKAIDQVSKLTFKALCSDWAFRNLAVIMDELDGIEESQALDEGVDLRIALVDLEDMNSAAEGIFGGDESRPGLVRCLFSEEQIDRVLAEAQQHGVVNPYVSPEQIKRIRMEELAEYHRLQNLYEAKGILHDHRKPIQIDDLSSLGFDLEEEGEISIPEVVENATTGKKKIEYTSHTVTFGQVIEDTIAAINQEILNAPEEASAKGKRRVYLSVNNDPFTAYNNLGLPARVNVTEEEEKQIWLRRIFQALVDNGHIASWEVDALRGYIIQA